ncbi:radical SAM protein [Eubacterium sp. An11]|uniref:B12-binding domain-containing radical SAM protein n=1 Tax=Eubacterium sp. An11 TaxID=1965542 RepID=UPI000B391ABF|nr:radical SAM protein [Eubacterium sp. An11]OUQ69278.1 radical SAM protein [Eubacterium sp. An11]
MRYEGTVYRPPSEARSLIIQVTIGCSHNTCTFCTMYKDKKFRIRSKEEIFMDLDEMSSAYGELPLRIFLADGDALVLKTRDLLDILSFIRVKFPFCERVTAYATARDILRKTDEELQALKKEGLSMVYVGAESGDPVILAHVKKDVTVEEMIQAADKLKKCGIQLSLTLISGLGGKERLREHALESARLVSAMKPEYLGFLTLMLEKGAPILEEIQAGQLTLLSPDAVMEEMKLFLTHVDSDGTVFRANHASNYLALKGTLNGDIPAMLAQVEEAEKKQKYKSERYRML